MNTTKPHITLPAEWAEQDAVLIAWPHPDTDWNYMLDEVEACYMSVAEAISNHETLIIATPQPDLVSSKLAHLPHRNRICIVDIDTNDTWARDFGPITVETDGVPVALDFKFNGWGLKFASNKDNLINRALKSKGVIAAELVNRLGFVLEGGSIESDGNGTIMTTSNCLLSPNRNGEMSRQDIEDYLTQQFGARQVLWVDHGELAGDDTDSHIDTLARFLPGNIIAYTRCQDTNDCHYAELELMHRQIAAFVNADGKRIIAEKAMPLAEPGRSIFIDARTNLRRRRAASACHLCQFPYHQPLPVGADLQPAGARPSGTASAASRRAIAQGGGNRLPSTNQAARLAALHHHAAAQRLN